MKVNPLKEYIIAAVLNAFDLLDNLLIMKASNSDMAFVNVISVRLI